GTEGHPGASGGTTGAGSGRAGHVPVAELRGGDQDADPWDPEGCAGAPAGMAAGEGAQRSMVENPGASEAENLARGGEGGVGLAAAGCGAGASDCGRTAGGVGIGWAGLVGDPALRGGTDGGETEDVFGVVSRTELRREPLFPGDRAELRDGPSRIRFESRSGVAERD